jgi:hypothetical protein
MVPPRRFDHITPSPHVGAFQRTPWGLQGEDTRARILALSLLSALLLAGMLALAATGGWVAHADAQPALTVSVKSGSSTQTTYTVVASNFPANATLTETFGDGSAIPPTTGQTDANGGMTRFWTFDVANTYCGTLTAASGTAQASASFWVAPTSDSRSGTACDGGGGTASPTPNATATTAAQATAAATAVPTQTPIPQPTAAPASSGGLVQGVLGNHLLLLVGGGALALLAFIIVVLAIAAGTRKPQRATGARGGQAASWNGGWNAPPGGARQGATGWRMPAPGAPYAQQPHAPPAGPRHEAPQGWPQPQPGPRTPNRIPGAGRADPRWRIMDDEPRERDRPEGTPDPRWSRSQPGSRGGRGPAGAGTPGRIRTLRDFTDHHPGVRPTSRDDDPRGW